MIKNIKLVFAYDGSKFSGIQYQNDRDSIQASIENAIYKVTKRHSRLIIAGRTDAGVHAYGQVANFLTASDIPAEAFVFKLRQFLPESIELVSSSQVDLDFHSRFKAKSKTYLYRIYNGKFMHPSFKHIFTHVTYNLDVGKMREASEYLCGFHDFKAFSKYENKEVNTCRTIDYIDIKKKDEIIDIEIKGDSFLYNQVRIMVGVLVDAGRGHIDPSYVKEIVDSKDRLKAGITYGPQGLYLMKIDY